MEREDGQNSLVQAFAAVGNSHSGLGTARDPLQSTQVNSVKCLPDRTLEALYRSSRIIEKVIRLLPEAAVSEWVEWSFGDADIPGQSIDQYLKRLKIRQLFQRAGMMGRLYGDGYIVLGINDNQPWSEPVNEKAIASIEWAESLGPCDLSPDWAGMSYQYENPEHYRLYLSHNKIRDRVSQSGVSDRIHPSRVLRFPGKRLFGEMLSYAAGENDSVIQCLMDAFNAWAMGMGASAAMLQDHSLFIYALDGLAKLSKAGETDALMSRFQAIQMGKSVLKGLMLDADNESANFINRQYGGVPELNNSLGDRLVAEADMPASKLFGSPKSGAFSESGMSDRYEWADCVRSYQNSFFREPLETLQRYVLLAKDGPTKGRPPMEYGVTFRPTLQLTRHELADLKFKNAQADGLNIRNGILKPEECRESRFSGAEYSDDITLIEGDLNPEPEPPQSQPQQQSESDANLERLRSDAALGLIPRRLYLDAAGYDADQIESLLSEELEGDTGFLKKNIEPLTDDTYNTDEYRLDQCLRDARGRFAGGYCGGGRKGGGKKGGAKKVETSLARKRREMKEARGGALAPSTIKAKERKAQNEKLNQERNGIDNQLAAIKRNYGKVVTNPQDAQMLGVTVGQRAPAGQLAQQRTQLQTRRSEIESQLNRSQSRTETFRPGRALSDRQMNRPLSQDDLSRARNFPTQQQLQQMRVTNPDRYERVQSQIQQYNAARANAPGLTPQEYLAVNNYTRGSGYIAQNAAARGLFNDPNSQAARDGVRDARLTNAALNRLPPHQGTVRRDTSMPSQVVDSYRPGQVVRFDGVTSTTTDLSGRNTSGYRNANSNQTTSTISEQGKAQQYNQRAQSMGVRTPDQGQARPVQYEMNVRNGRNVSQLSAASRENEVALPHGWQGRVTRTETLPNGTTKVYLDEV